MGRARHGGGPVRVVISNPRRGWGGASTVAEGLARGLAVRGHDVAVFCNPRGRLPGRLEGVVDVRPLLRGADVPVLPALRCARELGRIGADVVLSTHPLDAKFAVAGAALAGVPVALHRPSALPRRPGPLARRLEDAAVRAHVAPSDAVRRGILEREPWVPPEAVVVIPNGVDVARLAGAERAPLDLPEGAVAVGYVGRIAPEKGVETLGRAWADVERRHRSAHLVVAGGGGAEAALRSALAGAERVRWLGFRDDAPSVIAALDLLVVPSLTEAFGLVAVEAMAAGVPVVASAVEGLAEVVEDGRMGVLVPPGDPAALAAAIARLASDAGARREMGEAGRRAAARYSLEAMAEGYERVILDRCLAPASGRPVGRERP